MRRCPASRCPVLIPDEQRYCAEHGREYEQRRGTPVQRGYGEKHRRLRAYWDTFIQARGMPPCARCREPIRPGQAFDLDHDDADRTRWLGPAHSTCNRAAGGRNGAATRNNRV